MSNFETTINVLSQLNYKIYREHWTDIQMNEDEDCRYTIALDKAISGLACIEQFRWERDVAISQLKDLGFQLGQKTEEYACVTKEEYERLLEYKAMYEDLCR